MRGGPKEKKRDISRVRASSARCKCRGLCAADDTRARERTPCDCWSQQQHATTIQQPAPSVALRIAARFLPTAHVHKLRARTSQPLAHHPQHAKMRAAGLRLPTRYTASSLTIPNQPPRCFATAAKVRYSASHFSSTPPGRPGLVSLAASRGLFSAARGRPQGRGGLPGPPRRGPAALEAARLESYAAAFAFARRAQGANRLPAFSVAAPAES
jgi:hypothetical protein